MPLSISLGDLLPLHWLLEPLCPLCGATLPACDCQRTGELPAAGVQGRQPLPWWAAGHYRGQLRQRILQLRRRPRPQALSWLAARATAALPAGRRKPLLVPIPSWKRRGANPLPGLLAEAAARHLGTQPWAGLERSRPVLGQHHLQRQLRQANQVGAFRCRARPWATAREPILLVDDILTTGATACQAAATLEGDGWQVLGLLCLARTPEKGRPVI